MAIGSLYNANNVVVGQAATFFAAANTALPAFTLWNQADPFDPAFFLTNTFAIGTATSSTLTVTNWLGTATTSTLTSAGLTAAAIQTALGNLANVGAGNVTVTGTSPTYSIVFKNAAEQSVVTVTPTGGTATLTAPLWTACGATDQGWTFGADKSSQTINIEEQSTPVATTVTSQSVSVTGALSEDITPTLTLALNATKSTVAPVVGTVPGYDLLTITDTPILYAVGMVTTNPQGFGRLIYAPVWTQLSNVSVNFRRASDKRTYPVGFQTVCNTNQIAVYNFTVSK